jgi:hypothetical protein
LRTALRQIREAIDAYKQAADDGRVTRVADASGYPPSLDALVLGEGNDSRGRQGNARTLLRGQKWHCGGEQRGVGLAMGRCPQSPHAARRLDSRRDSSARQEVVRYFL